MTAKNSITESVAYNVRSLRLLIQAISAPALMCVFAAMATPGSAQTPLSPTLFDAAPSADSVNEARSFFANQDTRRQLMALPQLQLDFGVKSPFSMFYAVTPGVSGLETTTFGFNMNTTFGSGSSYNGLMFFADTQRDYGKGPDLGAFNAVAPAAAKLALGTDSLIVQNLQEKLGGLQVHADFQDVGQNFAGFAALKLNNAKDKAFLDQLSVLEGQKGVQRFGFGLNYSPNAASKTPSNFSLNFTQIHDDKGVISEQALGYTSRNFHINYSAQDISNSFSHFSGLTDANKIFGAGEKGMHVSNFGFGFNFGGATPRSTPGSLEFQQQTFGDKSGSMLREALNLKTGLAQFGYLDTRTDAAFSRLSGLSDADKTSLALDIRHMFDPGAQAKDITQKDRDQAAKETGIDRMGAFGQLKLGKNGAAGTLSMSEFQLGDPSAAPTQLSLTPQAPTSTGGVDRLSLDYAGRQMHVYYANQSISEYFTRLGDLSDLEKAQLGNENGLTSRLFGLDYQVNKTTKFSFKSVDIANTQDAIASVEAAATTAGTSPSAAAKLALTSVVRDNLTFATTGLTFAANYANSDRNFARVGDLGLPAADKAYLSTDIGSARGDYTLHFDRVKGLTIDDYAYYSYNPYYEREHDIFKQSFAYTPPSKQYQLSFTRNDDVSGQPSSMFGTEHSALTFNSTNKMFGKGTLFNFTVDNSVTLKDGIPTGTQTELLHLETPKTSVNGFSLDDKYIAHTGGDYEDISNLNVHVKPIKDLSLSFTRIDDDSGGDEDRANDVAISTDKIDFQWQTTKNLALVGGVAQTQSSDPINDNKVVSLGLKGDPVKNLTLQAKFDEVDNVGRDSKDTADFSLSNKPLSFGPVKQFTITAKYNALSDYHKQQNETLAGRMTWSMWKNDFVIDYGSSDKLVSTGEQGTVTQLYQFNSDPNPKKWLHATFLYKNRLLIDGTQKLTRHFSADARLRKNTNLVYTFDTLPEDAKGVIAPTQTENITLKHTFRTNQSFNFFFHVDENQTTQITTSGLGAGYAAQLTPKTKFEADYSKDINFNATQHDHSDHYRLIFDQQINSTQNFSLSIDYRGHDQLGLVPGVQTNLDFHTKF